MKTENKFTFKEVELMINQIKLQIKNSTVDTKEMVRYFNYARVIKICKEIK